MFSAWMKSKLVAGRISMSIAQLEHELSSLTPAQIGSVIVTAANFCQSVRSGVDGIVVSRAIEDPSSLSQSDAQALYSSLEDILIAGRKQNEIVFSRSKERMGEEFAKKLRNDTKIMEVSMRLLLSRIAAAIDDNNKAKLSPIARRLADAELHIEEATRRLQMGDSIVNSKKGDEHYADLAQTASLYVLTYRFLYS